MEELPGLLRLADCCRLVQFLLQLQQLMQLLNTGGVGCPNAPRTCLHGSLISLGGLLEDHVDRSIRRNRHDDVLGNRLSGNLPHLLASPTLLLTRSRIRV